MTYNNSNDDNDNDDAAATTTKNETSDLIWNSNIMKTQVYLPSSSSSSSSLNSETSYQVLPLFTPSSMLLSPFANSLALLEENPDDYHNDICDHFAPSATTPTPTSTTGKENEITTATTNTQLSALVYQNSYPNSNSNSNSNDSFGSSYLYHQKQQQKQKLQQQQHQDGLGSFPTLAVYTTTTSKDTTAISSPKATTMAFPSQYVHDDHHHHHLQSGDLVEHYDHGDSELLSVAMDATSTLFRGVGKVLGFTGEGGSSGGGSGLKRSPSLSDYAASPLAASSSSVDQYHHDAYATPRSSSATTASTSVTLTTTTINNDEDVNKILLEKHILMEKQNKQNNASEQQRQQQQDYVGGNFNDDPPPILLGPLYQAPSLYLTASGGEYHDAPRRIESLWMLPTHSDQYAVATDTLGRVLLMDISAGSCQPIRLWKGLRDAHVVYINHGTTSNETSTVEDDTDEDTEEEEEQLLPQQRKQYLVIHSKVRKSIEVWPILQNTATAAVEDTSGLTATTSTQKVLTVPGVSTQTQLVSCHQISNSSNQKQQSLLCSCFLLQPTHNKGMVLKELLLPQQTNLNNNTRKTPTVPAIPSSPYTTHRNNILSIHKNPPSSGNNKSSKLVIQNNKFNQNLHSAHIKLVMLQQALSEDYNTTPTTSSPTFTSDHVMELFIQITHPTDLATALALVSTSSTLEDRGIVQDGSKFCQLALEHCHKVVNGINSTTPVITSNRNALMTTSDYSGSYNSNYAAAGGSSSPVHHLQTTMQYHQQLIMAYQHLREFESNHFEKHQQKAEEDLQSNPKSTWAKEGMAWMATHAQVAQQNNQQASDIELAQKSILPFSQFCRAFVIHKSALQDTSHHNKLTQLQYKQKLKQPWCVITLKDSFRTRQPILARIFRPLLHDAFSYSTITGIFWELGLMKKGGVGGTTATSIGISSADSEQILESYFGEWYLTCISPIIASQVSFLRIHSNIHRWLKDRVTVSVDARLEKEHTGQDTIILSTMHRMCSSSDEQKQHNQQTTNTQNQAFLLAATCHEAITRVVQKREIRTYGKVYNKDAVSPWETLLKRIRLVLLIQLRLFDKLHLLGVPAPLSVKNIHEFNLYNIIARDELRASQKQDEIAALEDACLQYHQQQQQKQNDKNKIKSSKSVNSNSSNNSVATPFTGGNATATTASSSNSTALVWRQMQQACISRMHDEERAEYLVELEPTIDGALLLYFPQYHNPPLLCAHRSQLLLQQMWLPFPNRMDILAHGLQALASLPTTNRYTLPVQLDLWQTTLRPVLQAYLFGLEHAPQLDVEVYQPLFDRAAEEEGWISTIGKAALTLLNLLEQSSSLQPSNDDSDDGDSNHGDNTAQSQMNQQLLADDDNDDDDDEACWPLVQQDPALEYLVQKKATGPGGITIHPDSLDFHRIIVLGCMVLPPSYLSTLASAVGGETFYRAFGEDALWSRLATVTITPQKPQIEKQMEFVRQAILYRTKKVTAITTAVQLDRFELDELETLAMLWSIDVRDVRTLFVLSLYELGKDALIQDLVTRSITIQGTLDLERLIEDGIPIVCKRLNSLLSLRTSTARFPREVLSRLDADLVEWIRAQAEDDDDDGTHHPINTDVSLEWTHILILSLLRTSTFSTNNTMNTNKNIEKETRQSLHSLSVLTGTLLKELEQQEI